MKLLEKASTKSFTRRLGTYELRERTDPVCQKEGKVIRSKPVRHFCKLCNSVQGFRTKHCKLCRGCVAKFDHHCYYTGTLSSLGCCVGEKNHRIYWVMLLALLVQGWLSMSYVESADPDLVLY